MKANSENGIEGLKIKPLDIVVALSGNPNVGKSTVFNSLTGLKQHTGNWPGKTVTNAMGRVSHRGRNYALIDLPGTYSLMANSAEEEVTRDYLCFMRPHATIIVADATCLERNLNLVLQTLEITDKAVVCVNLIDEAKRKDIVIDTAKLSEILKAPVVATAARQKKGLKELMDCVSEVSDKSVGADTIKIIYEDRIETAVSMILDEVHSLTGGLVSAKWLALRLLDRDDTVIRAIKSNFGIDMLSDVALTEKLNLAHIYLKSQGIGEEEFRDLIVSRLVKLSESINGEVVTYKNRNYNSRDRKIDRILTSKSFGIPIMLLMLGLIFWLTISGANYPSKLLSDLFFFIEEKLSGMLMRLNPPLWLHGVLIEGMYRTLAWVVSVMLPPMAIFFPLFTLLEDLGYLPRVAFNLDNFFKKARCHGKQALTMCMGFGCNAAGIVGCRIIDSPRERLIAMITNSFVPCNGRFPTLIAIISMFFAGYVFGPLQSVVSALMLTGVILLGIIMTLVMSRLLSMTVLKGVPSSFALELPPYRRPQIGKVIVRSIFNRTLFILGRAVVIALPAGILIWVFANVAPGGVSILTRAADFLDPIGRFLGMDGYILMAFILGFPANEIVVPIIIMSYMAEGSLMELNSLTELKDLFILNGWTWVTAVSLMLFSLMHWPCGTTCMTIKRESKSFKWTFIAFLLPTITGFIICSVFANLMRLLGVG
ncbi:MAG: ferrous iron transport protein B [Christensenellales bacterium]|jgi:ferrous iron transport protein B